MNRIIYLSVFLVLFLSPLFVKADVLLQEDFTIGSLPSFPSSNFPSNWRNSSIQGSAIWTFQSNPSFGSTTGATGYAIFDDAALGPNVTPNEAFMATKVVDCSNLPNVYVSYTHHWFGVEFTHGYVEVSTDGGTVYTPVFDYHTNTRGSLSAPQDTSINISAWAANQPSVRIRFRYTDGGQTGQFWYIDDLFIHTGTDVALTRVVPEYLSCNQNYGAAESVTVRVENRSIEPISNIPLGYNISGGATANFSEIYTGTIPPFSYIDHTFTGTIDMSFDDVYIFEAYTNLSGDELLSNDTLLTDRSSVVSKGSYPYNQDFNTEMGGWEAQGSDAGYFTYGDLPYLNGGQGNGKCFYTETFFYGGSGYFPYLVSPVFDLTTVTDPTLSMDLKFSILMNNYMQMEVTVDGGNIWEILGSSDDSDWYNSPNNRWTGTQDNWKSMSQNLCEFSGERCVQFRFKYRYSSYGINSQFAFDNFKISGGEGDDLQAMQFFLPDAGDCAGFTSTEPIGLTIRNNTCRSLTNIPVQIDVTGPASLTFNEIVDGPIPAFGYYHYEFAPTMNMTAVGSYSFKATITNNLLGDSTDFYQDTALLSNEITETRMHTPINTFPYFADFNTDNDDWASTGVNPETLMARDTFTIMGGSEGYGDSWFLDDVRVGNAPYISSWVESPVFDLSATSNPNLYMDIKYYLPGGSRSGQMEYSTNGTTWSALHDYGEYEPNWATSYLGSSWVDVDTSWHQVQYPLCDYKNACIKFRIKVTKNSIYVQDEYSFAFDNFEIRDEPDAGVTEFVQPFDLGCLFSEEQEIKIAVYNWSCSPMVNVPVGFGMTGTGTASFSGIVPGPIPPYDSIHYSFTNTVDMTPVGVYDLSSWVEGSFDNNPRNDTLKKTFYVTRPKITTFPYDVDFDITDEMWVDTNETADKQFHWGTLPYLNGPEGNGDCWYTDFSGSNGTKEVWLESPVYDFSKNSNPILYMDLKFDLPNGADAIVEYSINGGVGWSRLGSGADSSWYNTTFFWGGFQDTWTTMSKDLCELSGEPCVKLRIVVSTYYPNTTFFAVDNFRITGGNGDDLEPVQLYLPDAGSCSGFAANEKPGISLRNNFCRPLTNVPISISMVGPDSTVVLLDTVPGPVPRFGYYHHALDQELDMSAPGEYSFEIEVFSNITGEGLSCINDTFAGNNILIEPRYNGAIDSFPYLEDFESGKGGWAADPSSNVQLFLMDSLPYMNGPEGYGNSWFLERDKNLLGTRVSYVESPVFDLTGMTNPQLFMDIKRQLPSSNYYATIEFSNNGGSWTVLGSSSDPNWMNGPFGRWIEIDTSWDKVQYSLCSLKSSCVKFRLKAYFASGVQFFAFDNFEIREAPDVAPTVFVEPAPSGCLYDVNQQVKVAIYNFACTDAVDIPVTCTVTGSTNSTFTGVMPGPIPSGDTAHYVLPGTFDMTPLGFYYFEVTTNLAADQEFYNDKAFDTIEVVLPKIANFPYSANFDNSDELWVNLGSSNSNNEWVWDSLPYLGGAEGFGKSWYSNTPTSGNNVHLETPVFDLSSLSNPQMSFDVKMSLNGHPVWRYVRMQYSLDGGTTWQILGTTGDPQWYETQPLGNYWWYGLKDSWTQMTYSLCQLTGESCVKLRFDGDLEGIAAQFAIDNFYIGDYVDIAPVAVIAPIQDDCLYTAAETVSVEYYNWSCSTIYNVPVGYEISGPTTGFANETIDSIPAQSTVQHDFSTTIDLLQVGTYEIKVFTSEPNEYNRLNDTVLSTITVDHLLINTFDYFEDFNASGSGLGNWVQYDTTTTKKYLWGQVPYLGGPDDRASSWYVDATQGGHGMPFYLESPVYDFSTATNPELFLELKFNLLGHPSYQYGKIEYTTDAGTTWTTLGTTSDPNWYNAGTEGFPASNVWYGNVPEWTLFHHGLCPLIGESCVKFRLAINLVNTNNGYGDFAIDNWHITDTEIDAVADLVYSCSGSEYEIELTVTNRALSCITAPVLNDLEVGYSVDGGTPITHSYSALNIAEGATDVIIIPNTNILGTNSVVKVWIYDPNSLNDQIFENDTIIINADQWPSCNDHCSNAQFLTIGSTTTSQTSNATLEPAEDPTFSNCGAITIENTVWYSFMTDAQGGFVTVDFENILCSPSANGIQVSIDELNGPPCQTSSFNNIYCNSPADTLPFGYGPVLLPPNTTYYIVVDGFAGNSCDFDIVLDGAIFNPNPSGQVVVNNNLACNSDNSGTATVLASDGTLPYTYAWDNGETTPTATALSAGTHTVTVTEASGNTFTASVQLTEPTAITTTVTANSTVSCNGGNDGTGSISATGGTPGYSYNWDNGATTATTTGLTAGTHAVTLTDANGCIVVESIVITSPTAIEVSTTVISNVSCDGLSDGAASISGTGGTPSYSILWDNGETTSTATALSAGAHMVTLTDANGCSVVESVMITAPSAIAASTSVISMVSCNGLNDGSASITANGGTPAYSFLWDNGETTATAISLTAGMHSVTLTDANGCAVTESIMITTPSLMTADTIIATEVSCSSSNDGTATITITGGTAGYTYTWDSGATTATATGLSIGMYSVTATDVNGCFVVATVQVPASSVPDLVVFTQTDEVSCGGMTDGVAIVSASFGHMPYSYLWDANAGNQTTATATGLAIGVYMVTVTDNNGCSSVDGVLIAEEACDYCQIADDNNTDICVVLTADPNDPLASLDCDGDGVRNFVECNDTTDPTDPCDFVEANITEPITADQSGCINLCPDLTVTTTLLPGNISGLSAISVKIDVTELNLVDAGPGPITVRMPSDPRLTFNWNITANPSWNYLGNTGIFHTFTYNGNNGILFGGTTESILISLAEGVYDPQGTEGRTTITASVIPFSGGECTLFNNADAETLVYFQ